jgi:very-long-chain enoyl-CoA reductase
MNLQIESKGKSISLQLPKGATVKDLKAAYAKETKKSIYRLSFKNGTERLDDDSKSLDDYGLKKDATIQFKDLGPQIGYRFVFVGEL